MPPPLPNEIGAGLTAHKKTRLWSPGSYCPPLIKFFCRTSTLTLVREQFAICVFALHALARSSAAGFQAPHHEPPQSVDSGLQVPSAPLVVCGAATSLATESVESGVVEPSASVAESSTAATGSAAHPPSTSQSDGQKVRAKPSHHTSTDERGVKKNRVRHLVPPSPGAILMSTKYLDTRALSLSLSLPPSLPPSLTHTHTHSLSLSVSLSVSRSLSASLSLPPPPRSPSPSPLSHELSSACR